MVAVTKRFESRPIKSRVGAFPDVFGMTNGRFKGTESRSEPRVRFRLAAGKSGYYCDVYVGGKVRVSEFMIFLTLQHWGQNKTLYYK